MRRSRSAVCVLALAVAACGAAKPPPAPDRSGPVRQVAREFFASILANDDARTCELFSASARYGVIAGGKDCTAALARRMEAIPVPALVRARFVPKLGAVRVDGAHATVKLRQGPLTAFNPELRLLREQGRWRIDDDEPANMLTPAGSCVWGYARYVLKDSEWAPWSDRSRAEYTVRFCRLLDERGLMGVDDGPRLAHAEEDVVNALYDAGLMTAR